MTGLTRHTTILIQLRLPLWYVNTCEYIITYNDESIVIYNNNQDILTQHNQKRDL